MRLYCKGIIPQSTLPYTTLFSFFVGKLFSPLVLEPKTSYKHSPYPILLSIHYLTLKSREKLFYIFQFSIIKLSRKIRVPMALFLVWSLKSVTQAFFHKAKAYKDEKETHNDSSKTSPSSHYPQKRKFHY